MKGFLVRCYPARWRERYGEEFVQILTERPLGPFDVADVLLGALDAHLHLRGLGAASQHGKGFAMSLRIGGLAAIVGGGLWAIGMFGAGVFDDSAVWSAFIAVGTVALLVALTGLSAFQARRHPRLTWAAFIIPAVGAIAATIGLAGMLLVGDGAVLGDVSGWFIWMVGTAGLMVGAALFGIVTWLSGSFSRPAAALLVAGSVGLVPAVALAASGTNVPTIMVDVVMTGVAFAFGTGWAWLGASALRLDGGPYSAASTTASP